MRPDPNQWAVSAAKPEDYEKFDSLVEQKLLNRRINMGYSRSNRATERVHETFSTEEKAKNYAI